MAKRKQDRRVIRTKKMLRDALTTLMVEKGFEGVTVSDLTVKADVNRATFYLHYRDKYDLLTQSEEEIITELDEIVKVAREVKLQEVLMRDLQNDPLPFVIEMFAYFHQNADFLKAVLGPKGDPSFQEMLKETIKRNMLQHLVSKLDTDKMLVPVDYFIAYVSSAHLGVIQHWLESGMNESPKEMATTLARMTLLGPAYTAGVQRDC
ncbi:TetR/AcrR family transcriptional regulator [Ectobacillus sp. JY-23]|uniref:TetR/AcrR family transcriptional regulator n=1 Tax=Ectobacillus sp. JY-23 TaxID=2933872 RepID=UPI001FF2C49A|nr:TetR/AcrR family transcriptional regulator [Ectobacillus sp. JY-23]UOY91803.1 TetR/AcrR family transcriptional regulator [Ectobacillus sp. JY-23]